MAGRLRQLDGVCLGDFDRRRKIGAQNGGRNRRRFKGLINSSAPRAAVVGGEARRDRRALHRRRQNGRAADVDYSFPVSPHLRVFLKKLTYVAQNFINVLVTGFGNPVVHPQAFFSRSDYPGFSQIREMPRNFRLVGLQHFDEKADANFVVSHQI